MTYKKMPVDGGGEAIQNDMWANSVEKKVTFAGGTANAIGDYDGTGNPFTIFTVTGSVLVKILAVCETDLAGASATLEVGIAGNTAKLIAQSTATDIDAGEIWHDATPDSKIEASSVLVENIIANGSDIIGTVATANITAGVIRFVAIWYPLSEGSSVTASSN
jgi:hypothetical protein